ncbi:MAG: hypothetical protein ACP5NS_04535 [Candidatus Pacearchaeota archaeon]
MNRAVETLVEVFDGRPYSGQLKVTRKIAPITGLREGHPSLNDFFFMYRDENPVDTNPRIESVWRQHFQEGRNLLLYGIRAGTTKGRFWGTNPAEVLSLVCLPGEFNDLKLGGRSYSHDERVGIGTAHVAVEYHLNKGDGQQLLEALNDPSFLNEALALSRGVRIEGSRTDINIYNGFMAKDKDFDLEKVRRTVRENKRLKNEGFSSFETRRI